MGLSSFFNPDILIGMGQARQKERENLLSQEADRRKAGTQLLSKIFESPDLTPEAREVVLNKLATATMLEPGKPDPKGLFSLDDVLNVRPQVGKSVARTQVQELSNEPNPYGLTPSNLGLGASELRAPEAPQDYRRSGFYSPEEQQSRQLDTYRQQRRIMTDEDIRSERAKQQAEYEFNTLNPPKETDEYASGTDGMVYSKRTGKVVREGIPNPSNVSVAERQMNDWLLKNPGKGPSDYQAFVASQGGEPLYPVVENGRIVYRPRSAAVGADAPRTTYDISGMPTTGGQQGVSLTPPPAIDATTQTNLAGWKLAIDNIDKQIIPAIKNASKVLGPFAGRVKLFEVEKLGGMGATKPQIELAINLRRLLMSQAFAEGGKQLTPTEKEEFIATNPAMTDYLDQAMIKAQLARDYLDKRYQFRLSVMPVRQRGQLGTLAPPTDQRERVQYQGKEYILVGTDAQGNAILEPVGATQ